MAEVGVQPRAACESNELDLVAGARQQLPSVSLKLGSASHAARQHTHPTRSSHESDARDTDQGDSTVTALWVAAVVIQLLPIERPPGDHLRRVATTTRDRVVSEYRNIVIAPSAVQNQWAKKPSFPTGGDERRSGSACRAHGRDGLPDGEDDIQLTGNHRGARSGGAPAWGKRGEKAFLTGTHRGARRGGAPAWGMTWAKRPS